MTIPVNRDDYTEPLRLRATRTVGAGEVEQRLARGRPSSAVAEPRRNRSIRAWRAADAEVSKAPRRADRPSAMLDTKPAGCRPAAASPTGPRPNDSERTARMRAIEQAWKAERARQAELEADADDETRQDAEALRQAEAREAKRQADERIRLALERAKQFRAEVSAGAGEQQPSRLDRDRAGRSRKRARRPVQRSCMRLGRASAGRSGPERPVRQTNG